MQIKEVIDLYEKKYKAEYAEDWDNSGLQLGDPTNELKNIILALEVTPETIEAAIENDANFIFTHHPLIFPHIDNVAIDDFKGKKIIQAIKNDITIYASHTPSDLVDFNTYVFNRIGFESEGKIVKIDENLGFGDYASTDRDLDTIIKDIKDNLSVCNVLVYGDKTKFSKVGLQTGTGMDFIKEVRDLGIDLYITSDIKHHEAMDAIESGITLLDISHQGSEAIFTDFAEETIGDLCKENNVKIFKFYNDSKYLRTVK